MNRNYIFLFIFLCFTTYSVQAQYFSLSEDAEVSILTIGPGAQLYDKFGHSAFRIKDENNDLDLIYNYGVYDFDTPNFYTKFARGKLLYKLGVSYYEPFFESYVVQNRWVKEQLLDLTYTEKLALFSFLEKNALPENQYYKYDFFYDNCATKIRDVLVSVLDEKLTYKNEHITDTLTFRELIQKNVYWNSWGSLGMDVAIGAVVDKKATPWEYQFLPDYIFEAAANATIEKPDGTQKPLIKETKTLFENTRTKESRNFFLSPLFFFGILGLLILFVTYKDHKKYSRSRYLDTIIFLITGLIGIFLLLLWVATDHTATANNYNMLWAFPLSILFLGVIGKKHPRGWVRRYIIFLILLLLLMVVHWFTGVQVFAIGFIPLLVALFIRYLYVIYYLKKETATAP